MTIVRTSILPRRSITVPSILSSSPLPPATVGQPYSAALVATGGAGGPYVWAVLSDSPNTGNWLSINANSGVLSGTPTTQETESILVQVKDQIGIAGVATFSLNVFSNPTITTASPLPNASVGTPYSFTMAAAGGVPPYSWAVTSDSPDSGGWLSINSSTGVLSGTPGIAETESLTIKVTDSLGHPSAPTNFTLTVNSTQGFDFYISPTGDDTNTGSFNSPWSITALNNNRGTYAGKRVGFMPGTHTQGQKNGTPTTLFALCQALTGGSLVCALTIEGGPGATATYLASCDFNGNYSPRTATISCFDPATGNPVTVECSLMGQSDNNSKATQPATFGNFVVDGLRMTGWKDAAVQFSNQTNVFTTWFPGIQVINCEFFTNSPAFSNINPGAVHFLGTLNALIQNNLFYNLTTTAASAFHPFGCPAVQAIGANPGIKVKNNTAYNCGWCYSLKDFGLLTGVGGTVLQPFPFGGVEFSYNYADNGQFGVGGQIDSMFQMIADQGQTTLCHHNIIVGLVGVIGAGAGVYNRGTSKIYNNTLYATQATQTNLRQQSDPNFSPLMVFQNNIVWNPTGVYGNGFGAITLNTSNQAGYNDLGITPASMNFNYYNVNMRIGDRMAIINMTPAQWTALGYDAGSVFSATSPFVGTPAVNADFSPIMASWATGPQAILNGTMSGALDGTGPVGCNFTAPASLQITTSSLPNGAVGTLYAQQLAATGGVPALDPEALFTQPNITNGIAPNFVVAPIQGTPGVGWFMAAWQPSAFGNGTFVANSSDVSALTGFAPVNPATAQLSSHNVPGSTTAQMEGGTVGAYINTNDIQNTNNKMMIEPEFDFATLASPFPFAGSDPLKVTLNLQVPTATGVVNHVPPVYTLLDMRFIDPNGVRISIGVKMFRSGGDTATGTNFDAPSNSFLLNWAPGFETRFATLTANSNIQQSTTWTGYKPFGWTMSAAQFQTALNVLSAAFPGQVATMNPALWYLARIHLNAEIQIQGTGPFSLGWSMNSLTVNGDVATYSWSQTGGTLPAGLQFFNSGLLAGTPTASGSFSPTFQVEDTVLNTATANLPFTVAAGGGALQINTASLPNATIGTTYTSGAPLATIQASGGTAPYSYFLQSAQPNHLLWLFMDGSGNLVGTPQAIETMNVTVGVADSASPPAVVTKTLSLSAVSSGALTILSTAFPNVSSGGFFSADPIASGGVGTYRWSQTQVSGTSQMEPLGPVTSTPTAAGTISFTLTATDAAGASTTSPTITVTVDNVLRVQRVNTVDNVVHLAPALAGQKYAQTAASLFAAGGTGTGFTWTPVTVNGLTLNANGTITGTPLKPGVAQFTAQVTDSGSNTASATCLLNVSPADTASRPSYNTGSSLFVSPQGKLYDTNGNRLITYGFNEDINSNETHLANFNGNFCRYTQENQTFSAATQLTQMNGNCQNVKIMASFAGFYYTGTSTISGQASQSSLQSMTNWFATNFSSFSPYLNKMIVNIANEWGPIGRAFVTNSSWVNGYAAAPAGVAGGAQITGISGSTITIAGGSFTSNPFAALAGVSGFAWIKGAGGYADQMVTVTGVGGSQGAGWTLTCSAAPTGGPYTSGGAIAGGAVGVLRLVGFTCPFSIDSPHFGQDIGNILTGGALTINQSDPFQSCMFNTHAYGFHNPVRVQIASITTGATTTFHLNSNAAIHPFNQRNNQGILTCAVVPMWLQGGSFTTINGNYYAAVSATYGGSQGAWTVAVPNLNTTGFTGYVANSGWLFDGSNPQVLGMQFSNLAANGLCMFWEEFANYVAGPQVSNLTTMDVYAGAAAWQCGAVYWSVDGGDGSAMAANGNFTTPNTLIAKSGQPCWMHTRISMASLATAASQFL